MVQLLYTTLILNIYYTHAFIKYTDDRKLVKTKLMITNKRISDIGYEPKLSISHEFTNDFFLFLRF